MDIINMQLIVILLWQLLLSLALAHAYFQNAESILKCRVLLGRPWTPRQIVLTKVILDW